MCECQCAFRICMATCLALIDCDTMPGVGAELLDEALTQLQFC